MPGRHSLKHISRSALLVSSGILLSRVLGLVRDVTFARHWGTGTAFAAFTIAFMVPNLLRALFGEGAFSAAFVPTFSGALEKDGKSTAWEGAQRVISVLLTVLAGCVGVVILASLVLRPFARNDLDTMTLRLLPLVMPYAVLICGAGALAGVLNSLQRFTVPALSPVLLNVVLIIATTCVCPYWGVARTGQVYALGIAVLFAGVLQFGVHLHACRRQGLVLRFVPDWRAPEVRHVVALIAPALIGTGVTQFNALIDKLLARILGSMAVSSLYYSQRLVYLPVGLFGVAMAVVALPAMSRAWACDDRQGMEQSLVYALRHVLFLALPVACLLGPLAGPVVRLLFERGSFDAVSTRETVWALRFYLPGIPAFACAKIAVTPFYAKRDTRTPVKVGCVCLVLNVILNLSLMWWLKQGGLALSTSVCSYVNVGLLLWLARRDLENIPFAELARSTARLGVAALLAVSAATLLLRRLPATDTPELVERCLLVFVPLVAGGAVYLAAAFCLGAPEVRELIAAVRGKAGRR